MAKLLEPRGLFGCLALASWTQVISTILTTVTSAKLKTAVQPKYSLWHLYTCVIHTLVFSAPAAWTRLPCHYRLCLRLSPDYLRRDVLPAEQHVASDLPRLLHPDAHLLQALRQRETSQVALELTLPDTERRTATGRFVFLEGRKEESSSKWQPSHQTPPHLSTELNMTWRRLSAWSRQRFSFMRRCCVFVGFSKTGRPCKVHQSSGLNKLCKSSCRHCLQAYGVVALVTDFYDTVTSAAGARDYSDFFPLQRRGVRATARCGVGCLSPPWEEGTKWKRSIV